MMVVALAGRRIDAPDAGTHRFPFRNINMVKERLRAFFLSSKASVLVCSAACGADLLALDIAGELNLERRILLPFSPGVFEKKSVLDCEGDWQTKFESICNEVGSAGNLTILHLQEDEQNVYERTNIEILNLAESIAGLNDNNNKNIVALAVWEGGSRGPDDATAHLLEEAKKRKIPIAEINTLQ